MWGRPGSTSPSPLERQENRSHLGGCCRRARSLPPPFLKVAGIFAISQVLLSLSEGLLTLLVWNWLQSYGKPELQTLHLLQQES
jgi:hypothetical protein